MGGKGKNSEKYRLEEEEAKKREEDARRLAQEAENWLKIEEEEKKRVSQEAARKRKEEAEIKKKRAESEGFRLRESIKEKHPTEQVDVQEVQDPADQEQGRSDLDPLEPVVSSRSILG